MNRASPAVPSDSPAAASANGSACRKTRYPAHWLVAAAVTVGLLPASALALDAPNVVPVSATLVTSGQPTRDSLEGLAAEGFEVVVYLAPPTVWDAVADESALVERHGLKFVHIPIPFNAPTEAHFEALSAALVQAQGRKVLVHCQMNMRASTLVFLHRVVAGGEPAAQAYEAVTRVWSPDGPWKNLVMRVLRKHRIEFEPY